MEEALIKRTMPNSLEAEQSVIGSMIVDKDAILTASEILHKDDFYHQQYGVLFEAIVELYNDRQPVDLVTLQNKLKEKDVPAEVASLEYIGDLVAAVPLTVNVEAYANIVKDKALLRQIIRVNQELENELCRKGGCRFHPGEDGEGGLRSGAEPGRLRLCAHQRGGHERHQQD